MAKITIYVPDEDPIKVGFDQEAVTIGRAPDNDLIIPHDSISGHHAKLVLQEDDSYSVVDLGSTNGIKVEDIETGEGPLSNGTKVTFGKVDAVYECEEANDEEDEDSEEGDTEPYASNMEVEIAEASTKPDGFTNLSPFEKAEEKNQFAKVAMLVGLIAIISAVATFGAAAIMKVG